MKLPNGFGSVYKLSGHRRNPWCARKTVGWTFDEDKQKAYPIYKFIGYYPSRKDALTALTEYNKDPYDIDRSKILFSEVYDRWSSEAFKTMSDSNIRSLERAYTYCRDLYDMRICDIRLEDLQGVIDKSGKNTPTLKKMKNLFGKMWEWCIKYEVIPPDRKMIVKYADISKTGNPNKVVHTPFKRSEIDLLWKQVHGNDILQIPLFLIYSGIRIGEFYNLKKSDVHLQEKYFFIGKSKTDAGIRQVPIADRILWIVQEHMQTDSEYLFCNTKGNKLTDGSFRPCWWGPMMTDLGFHHTPHDTRHTCISLLTVAGVDERIIRQIVGHKGSGVTETVYTHIDLQTKLDAINRI